MGVPKLPMLDSLPRLGKSSWLLLPPVCGLFPRGSVDALGAVVPRPNSWSSAGGGNAGGGDGENDDFAGVIMVVPVVERDIRELGRNEVSSAVMTKSLGILTVDLFALCRFAGPVWNDGEAERGRCGGLRALLELLDRH